MTDTIVLLANFDGNHLTFKLLQQDCIQVSNQYSVRLRLVAKNPHEWHFPLYGKCTVDSVGIC
jgi:hypothetical protein